MSSYPNCSVMSAKRKRVTLTLHQKLQILARLKGGEGGNRLAREYGIGTSTVSDIRRNASALELYAAEAKMDTSQIKSRKTALNVNLDKQVFKWYVGQKEGGFPVTDAMVCAKARELNRRLKGSSSFKASAGWLRHFKRRNGIFIRDRKDDFCTTEMADLQTLVNKYNLNDVYVLSKFTINWKSLPKNKGDSVVTLVACTNATGSNKLPLHLIGHGKPIVTVSPSVEYKKSTLDWFLSVFTPEILGKSERKFLIICDDDWEIKETKNVAVYHTPTIIFGNEVKRAYRKRLLEVLVESGGDVNKFLAELMLEKCVELMVEGWHMLNHKSVYKVFSKLLSTPMITCNKDEDMLALAQLCPGLLPCNMNDIGKWFESDKRNFDDLDDDDDDELDQGEESCEDESLSEEIKNERVDDEEIEEDEQNYNSEFEPSHEEAYLCLQRTIEWLGNQTEATPDQFSVLETLRDLASTKMSGGPT